MTIKNTPAMSLADFEHLLEVYGADRTRWPIGARVAAAACLASNHVARKLLAEAAALDAVLLKTEDPDKADVTALVDRIVSATTTMPRLAAKRERAPVAVSPMVAGSTSKKPQSDWMHAAALLAASLVIGIFVGQSQVGARAVPALEELTGISTVGSTDRFVVLDLPIESADED